MLMVAGTVCFAVLATGAALTISELLDPETDTSGAVRAVTGVINTLIGLMAGFLAGRTTVSTIRSEGPLERQPEPRDDGEQDPDDTEQDHAGPDRGRQGRQGGRAGQ